jgi:hypothetical protein
MGEDRSVSKIYLEDLNLVVLATALMGAAMSALVESLRALNSLH